MKVLIAIHLLSAILPAVHRNDLPAEEIRRKLADLPRQEFLSLVQLPATRDEAIAEADQTLASGKYEAESVAAALASPIQWTGHPRSFSFHLNAWAPVVPIYVAAGQGAEERYFREGYRIALDWMNAHIPPVRSIATTEELDATIGQPEEFVWYDMGVGLRIYPLAWTLARMANDPACSDEEVRLFADGLYFHMEALKRPSFFRSTHNHGFFQMVGQLMAVKQVPTLPKMDEYGALALERLEKIVEQQFTKSWVHREHSPAYHDLLLRTFLALRTAGLPESPTLLNGIAEMEEALVWMYTPDFLHTAFGDTSGDSKTSSEKMVELLQNEALIFQITEGARGTPPPSGVKVYEDAGYLFARFVPEGQDYRQSSYLAQMSAFHSRAHKHADHMTFVWHDRGQPILVDAGKYGYTGRTKAKSPERRAGYWYSHPARMYVESTRAHNTVEIDGKDLPRHKVGPFGSALKGGSQQGELVVSDSAAHYTKTQEHRRLLIFRPGEFVLVIDRLQDEVPRAYTQWFTFAPRWEVTLEAGGYTAKTEGAPPVRVQSLTAAPQPLAVARGQKEPRMQGWHSDKDHSLIPASSIGFDLRKAKQGRFITLLTFADQLECDPKQQQVNEPMTELTLQWSADGKPRKLTVSAPEGAPVKVSLEEGAK